MLLNIFLFAFLFNFNNQAYSKDIEKDILITGGNRDIGLALVKFYLSQGWRVYTTYRTNQSSQGLLQINDPNLKILHIDFLEENSIKKIQDFIQNSTLDVIIHNACLFPYNANSLDSLDEREWLSAFYINAIFPIQLSALLKNNLKKDGQRKIVFISSRRGSNAVNIQDSYHGRYGYRTTKAALNSGALALSQDLLNENISIHIIHPGRVSTKITNYDGISPKESAHNIGKQINMLSIKSTGFFTSAENGKIINW